ncbi:MAG: hypothetical protein ACI39F_06435 [Acutalibacteraceae bacterium]
MKKTILILLAAVLLVFSACGAQKDTSANNESSANSAENDNTIETVKGNEEMPQNIAPSSTGFFVTAKRNNDDSNDSEEETTEKTTTVKTKATVKGKNTKTTAQIYEMQIKYSSIANLKSKVSGYKTFKDLMKSVDEKKNNLCINPFRQEYLMMIFTDKKVYTPNLPKDYKFKSCYLSSRNFFCFEFTEPKGEKQNIKIYTVNNNNSLKTNKYNLSFKSDQGDDIYKNTSGKYCWFLDDKYVVEYSGKSRDFINQVYFSTTYIGY